MTLRLILTRHAKSSWDDPRLSDHDRVLNGRGIRSCARLGPWIAGQVTRPAQALVSSAARTRETWERIAPALAPEIPARFESRLYHAVPEMMLTVLRSAGAPCVVMIGHNPGIAEFALRLVRVPPEHRDFRRYPTGATLVAEFPGENWAALTFACGTAAAFVTPRELDQIAGG